jgi:hypothetical protein
MSHLYAGGSFAYLHIVFKHQIAANQTVSECFGKAAKNNLKFFETKQKCFP